MTSIHTELLHLQFFVSPSAPGSENQYGLNRLRKPPIRLNAEVTPAAGGKAPTHSSTLALPASPLLQDHFGTHGINISLRK